MPSLRTWSKMIVPLVALAAAVGGAGYLQATRPAVEPRPQNERIWAVKVAPVSFGEHRPVLHLYGELVGMRRAVLQAPVEGRVVEIARDLVEGGTLDVGADVVRLDDFDYRARAREQAAALNEQEARLAELQSGLDAERDMLEMAGDRLTLAERDLSRQQKLQSSSFASKKSLDDARMQVVAERSAQRLREREITMLEARLDQQRAAIVQLEVAIDRNARDLADTEIKAPFDALVAEVDVALGKELKAYDRLATLIDRGSIEIRFSLDDADFGRLWQAGLIGRAVHARWHLGDRALALEGTVSRIESEIDAAKGGIQVYAAITGNPDGAPLRPGAFLDVEIEDAPYDDVALLPRTALFDPSTVYGVVDGRLEGIAVEVVDRGADTILVRGALDERVPVVTTRLAEIHPGLRVEIEP